MKCVEIKTGGRRNGLSILQESRLRERLRREVPSEPWLEAQFSSFTETDGRGGQSIRRVHNPLAFPPGREQTAMVRCPLCGVFTPPIAFEAGACLDHAEHESWGPSPSALAIRGLQFRNLRMGDAPLLPETTAALRSEILHFDQNASQAIGKRRRKF
ncbi:MAG TPA: hypothetical protein VG269_20280 [Tepidisphaeraceae bacterium]|jgi:hypothetical protein|nr:hypothetical protein [Tepidisphaeraceae bacterium]